MNGLNIKILWKNWQILGPVQEPTQPVEDGERGIIEKIYNIKQDFSIHVHKDKAS